MIMMDYEEPTLRSLLASSDADVVGNSILDLVASKIPLRVLLREGEALELQDVSDSLNHLRELGWAPN
jgi:hypothetical protein